MKKMALVVFVVSSVCVVTAGEYIFEKKRNTEAPFISSAVPPCPENLEAYLAARAALEKEQQQSQDNKQPKTSSVSPEFLVP
jgi:hypothetical protein